MIERKELKANLVKAHVQAWVEHPYTRVTALSLTRSAKHALGFAAMFGLHNLDSKEALELATEVAWEVLAKIKEEP